MNVTKTVTVTLGHRSSIQGARWCKPVGTEPKYCQRFFNENLKIGN